jgi:hypothetical protein
MVTNLEYFQLEPVFCCICGNRIGWAENAKEAEICFLFCEDCKSQPKKED